MTESNLEARLLAFVAGFEGLLPDEDVMNARTLIAKREWGVGLELLCTQLVEYDVSLTDDESAELKSLAQAMGLDVNDLGFAS